MLSSFIDRLLGRDITKTRTRKNRRQEGRANLRKELSRQLNLEHLEDRRLLTTYMQGGTAAATVHTGDLYYDSSIGGNYSDYEDSTIAFDGGVGTGGAGTQVRAVFSYVETEANQDYLSAYNGPIGGVTFIRSWDGAYDQPTTAQSTGQRLSFWFTSDYSITYAGWEASIYVINLDPNPIINAGDGDNAVLVQVDPSQTDLTNVFIDGALVDTFETANLNSLTINGQAGNDVLTVDLSNGNPLPVTWIDGNPFPVNGLRFDGGLGFDGIVLQGGSVTSDTYSPGAQPGEGLITLFNKAVVDGPPDVTRSVSFQNIEPVIDTLIAPTFRIASVPGIASLLDASNAINYTASQLIAGGGRVTVDNFEPIEFINKTTLVIDAGAGSDTINLNNPTTPTALTSVSVNGGGGSDTVTVKGQAIALDNVVYTPMGADSGKLVLVDGSGVPLPLTAVIQLAGVDRLIYDGQNKADTVKVILPARTNMVSFEYDAFASVGLVEVKNVDATGNLGPLLGIQFQNVALALDMTSGDVGNGVTIDGATNAGSNTLFYRGRAEVDQLQVTAVGALGRLNDMLKLSPNVITSSVKNLVLVGGGGNDVFYIAADHPYNSIIVTGGSPVTASNPDSGGDLVVVRGAAGRVEKITVTPNRWIDSETYILGTGPGATPTSTISTSGVGRIYYLGSPTLGNNPVADDTLVVDPGLGTHTVRVDAGRFTGSTASPLVMPGPYDRVTSDSLPQVQGHGLDTLQIAPVRIADAVTGSVAATFVTGDLTQAATKYEAALTVNDTLIIEGNDGSADNYTVTGASGTSALAVTFGTIANPKSVTATLATLGRLQINTLGGDDKVTVDVGGTDLITVPITFDGGTGSDLLTVTGTPKVEAGTFTTSATYTPGPLGNQGRLVEVGVGASTKTMTIDFANLEPVVDLILGTLTVNGTNADNAINYTAGPNNGIGASTGLVSVDGFESIEFINKTTLTIDGLAGNDTINLNNSTTPTGLGKDVGKGDPVISVKGGDPTGGSDTVVVNGTIVPDKVTITPAAADEAVITGTTYGTDLVQGVSQINVTTTESLIYNGRGGTDTLTITTPAGPNLVTLTPGATVDSGGVQVDSLVPMSFLNLGSGGKLSMADAATDPAVRVDTLVYNGTDGNDVFGVATSGNVTLNSQVVVTTPGVSSLTLNGLNGDDQFNVTGFTPAVIAPPTPAVTNPFTSIHVNGGDPDASDVLNLNDAAGAVVANLEPATVTGYGGTVSFTGIEHVILDGIDTTTP
ncbi:MAG: hypothetical protein NTY19_29250, partial [Planctomycetota bacterium]|nr:hypothetical protein [Planctomycetota bacterium]